MLAFSTSIGLPRGHSSATVTASCEVGVRRITPSMGPWKKGEKDEAFQQQQEILARRRDKQKNKQHFEEIEKRREGIEEFYDSRRLKVKYGEDPLVPWKEMKDKGLVDESSYSEMDEGGIPIPMASFGIPKYDNGARFDLRLPHVEIGYADPDADIMAKAGNAMKNLFGFGKKQEEAETKPDDKLDEESKI